MLILGGSIPGHIKSKIMMVPKYFLFYQLFEKISSISKRISYVFQ
jgi:hypothetical protein